MTDLIGRHGATRAHSGRRVLATLLGLAVSGCGVSHMRAMREAQDVFGRAAEAENRARLGDQAATADLSEAMTGYRVAAQLSADLITNKEKKLREDQLLCTAHTIRGLALWRLGDFGGALGTVRGAAAAGCTASDSVGEAPRDRALLLALPALVRIDQADAKRANGHASLEEYSEIKRLVSDARQELARARAASPRTNPVQLYLLTSELAAVRVWHSAVTKEGLTGEPQTAELQQACAEAVPVFKEYERLLTEELRRESNDPSLAFWKGLFGCQGM